MTGRIAKTRKTEEKLAVDVRQKSAKILDLRRIGLFLCLSVTCMSRVDDQTCWNRGPDCGIVGRFEYRSTDHDIKMANTC